MKYATNDRSGFFCEHCDTEMSSAEWADSEYVDVDGEDQLWCRTCADTDHPEFGGAASLEGGETE